MKHASEEKLRLNACLKIQKFYKSHRVRNRYIKFKPKKMAEDEFDDSFLREIEN